VAEPQPPQHISFFVLFWFFVLDFFLKNKIYDRGILKKKKKRFKVVELPQFESLGDVKCHI
jgi:hypothetical protein